MVMRYEVRSFRRLAQAAALIAIGLSISGAANAQSLVDVMAGRRWAVGGLGNCGMPSQSYVMVAGGGTITWQSGVGHVDVERVMSAYPAGFMTRTVSSFHGGARPVPLGTSWSYQMIDPSRIGVSSTSGAPFTLVACI